MLDEISLNEIPSVVEGYKESEQRWKGWAAAKHGRYEERSPLNFLSALFKRRAERDIIPEPVVLSLRAAIDGRRRAKEVYDRLGIRDSGRHQYPIQLMENLYDLATRPMTASASGSPNSPMVDAVANDLHALDISMQQHASEELDALVESLSMIEPRAQDVGPTELSALPGLLMGEILKCVEEVDKVWKQFFHTPLWDLVSAALVTSAANDCICSMTWHADLTFNDVDQREFERLAQRVEEGWAGQWSVERVHGLAQPMKTSAYEEELSKHGKEQQLARNPNGEGNSNSRRNRGRSRNRKSNRSSVSAVANYTSEGPLELTEALSHKALSAAVFVPIPNKLKLQTTSSLKLGWFRNSVSIHLWHLAAVNLADDPEEKDDLRLIHTAFRSGAMRHAYARSYQIWRANRSIRNLALKRTVPDPSLERIDCAIQSCHDRLERWPNLTLNPWLLGYFIGLHYATNEESFRRFTATNFTSFFGFLALKFAQITEDERRIYPRLREFTRTGCNSGSASLLGAVFGQGRYQRARYKPSSGVKAVGVEFLKDIGNAALLEMQPADWWMELAATRTLMDGDPDHTRDYFAIFEQQCRRYEEVFAVPLLRFGRPLPYDDDIQVVPAPAHDRKYQRQWDQELGGHPNEKYQRFFKDLSEKALMQHAGIPLGPEMQLEEHWLRASNCSRFNGHCVEFVLHSIRIGDLGFFYRLNEPLRLGQNFQSLRTATSSTLGPSTNGTRTIQKVGMVRQWEKFFRDVLDFRRRCRDSAVPEKKLVAIDSTFVYDEQVQFSLQVVGFTEVPEERPSRFLLGFNSMEVVLHFLLGKGMNKSDGMVD